MIPNSLAYHGGVGWVESARPTAARYPANEATKKSTPIPISPANKAEIAQALRRSRNSRYIETLIPKSTRGGRKKFMFGLRGRKMMSQSQIGNAVAKSNNVDTLN